MERSEVQATKGWPRRDDRAMAERKPLDLRNDDEKQKDYADPNDPSTWEVLWNA